MRSEKSAEIEMRGAEFKRSGCSALPYSALRNPHSALGVTLLEMLVVITIIAVAGAVVFPAVTGGLENLRLKSSADRLANIFRYARERALRRQTVCQVTVDPEQRRVELEDLGLAPAGEEQSYRRGWDLPPEIVFEEERPRVFLFPPDGGVPQVSLRMANARGRTATVELDALTALPRVRMEQ